MIRPSIVLALARAESRLTRRLVRFWLFQIIALIIGIAFFVYYALLHAFFSSWSGTAGMLNPRYLVSFLGIYYLVGFLLGLIFLGYDVRARDTRERMVEVLDSQPYTNVELLLGRFLGILITCWVPVLLISLIWYVLGLALRAPVDLRPLISFSFLQAIPAYAFVLGMTFLLTLLLRHRLVAALSLVGVVIGLIVINFGFVPIYLLPLVDITGGFSVVGPSDVIPGILDQRGEFQRLAFLLLGLGMVWFAAAVHPRRDDTSPAVTAGAGGALCVAGLLILGWLVHSGSQAIDTKVSWREAHAVHRDDAVPNLQRLDADVVIDPGRTLQIDVTIDFRAPDRSGLETALFSLNPGLEVTALTDRAERELGFEHHDGLLEVQLGTPLAAGESSTLRMRIEGAPDPWFAYLDETFDPLAISIREGNIFLLGFMPMIFQSRFTALMPGIRWLPASGAEVGRGDPKGRPPDFFELDLTVEVPEDWLLAGPGRRQKIEGTTSAGRARFRFVPGAPLPDVALIGGHYRSRSTEIDGVTLEVLVHPLHEGNLDFFADAADELRSWLEERLLEADEVGLPYPYDGLTLVEVPGVLRGYAGGWRMDTTFTQPAMVLMREAGFPTARFDIPFRDPDEHKDHEGGIPQAKREILERFFGNDFSGGNPFIAAARNFFNFQTSAEGDIALPLDYVTEDLATRLVTDKQGYFSVYHYGKDLNQTINGTIGGMVSEQTSVSDALLQTVTSRSDVWDQVLEVSLDQVDPWEAPKRTLDVLTLKGSAMSRSMLDDLGRAQTGEFLAALRERTRGGSYTREDLIAAGKELGLDLEEWLDTWIDQTDLPGFTVGKTRYERIEDDENGSPRYQLVLTLRNEEQTPGLVRLEYHTEEAARGIKPGTTDPFRIAGSSAMEVGVVTSEPLRSLSVVPYLALNRGAFGVTLPAIDEERIVDAEPFVGAREVEWNVRDDPAILIDDLDEGFSVTEGEGGSGLRVSGRGSDDEDTDQGLPVAQVGRPSSDWSRRSEPTAWGKYRHTVAQIRPGKGKRRAVFAAEIPRSGPWELEYHLPGRWASGSGSGRRVLGKWTLTVVDQSGDQEITFDAASGEPGWNSLGVYEIAEGETRVEITDAAEGGRLVVADAIRWVPTTGGGGAAP